MDRVESIFLDPCRVYFADLDALFLLVVSAALSSDWAADFLCLPDHSGHFSPVDRNWVGALAVLEPGAAAVESVALNRELLSLLS